MWTNVRVQTVHEVRSVHKVRPYNANLNDCPLIITTTIPDWLILISSLVDFVVDDFMVRPVKSIIVYLVSEADSINMVLP